MHGDDKVKDKPAASGDEYQETTIRLAYNLPQ